MSFAQPKDVARKFDISQKTVYNYLSKYGDKIMTKKEYGKTLINIEDFTEVLQKVYNPWPVWLKVELSTTKDETKVWTEFEKNESLQNEFKQVSKKNEELEKVLDDKSRQLSKYVLLYTEVKNEKKEIELKYDALQQDRVARIEAHSSAQLSQTTKYYRLLILTSIVLVLLIIWVAYVILPLISK